MVAAGKAANSRNLVTSERAINPRRFWKLRKLAGRVAVYQCPLPSRPILLFCLSSPIPWTAFLNGAHPTCCEANEATPLRPKKDRDPAETGKDNESVKRERGTLRRPGKLRMKDINRLGSSFLTASCQQLTSRLDFGVCSDTQPANGTVKHRNSREDENLESRRVDSAGSEARLRLFITPRTSIFLHWNERISVLLFFHSLVIGLTASYVPVRARVVN